MIVALAASVAALALAAPVWRETMDRLTSPKRYAVSGRARVPVDRYVAAVHAALPPGERIVRLALPAGGPVVASAEPARRPAVRHIDVYLDPPTARVLGIVSRTRGWFEEPAGAAPPLDRPAQRASAVIARAAPAAKGAVRSLAWPTERNPDWTVTFSGDEAIKVADDSGTARPARVRGRAALPSPSARLGELADRSAGWRIAILVASLLPLALAGLALRRARPTRRRYRASSTRA